MVGDALDCMQRSVGVIMALCPASPYSSTIPACVRPPLPPRFSTHTPARARARPHARTHRRIHIHTQPLYLGPRTFAVMQAGKWR